MVTPYGITGYGDVIYYGDDTYNAMQMVQFPQLTVTTLFSGQDTFPNDPSSEPTAPRRPSGNPIIPLWFVKYNCTIF